jgi:predicted RNA binding protein YcfA (HicA-like mRNA interferase family)
VKVRDVMRLLDENGWSTVRTRGSHRQLKHPTKLGTATVVGKPGLEMPPGTLNLPFY